MAKGDFYLLGVGQIRLLTRCKILVVASFLHCLQIIFSLKSPSPTLKLHMDLPSLIWIINLLARATLLPWLNVYIISLVKVSSETQRRSVESGKTAATVFKNGRESHWDYSWRPVSRLIRMFVCDLAHTQKIIFCPSRGRHLSRCCRDLLISGSLTANSTVRHTCFALGGELSSAKMPGTHQTKESL